MTGISRCRCCGRQIRSNSVKFQSKCGCFYHVDCIRSKIYFNSPDKYNCSFCNQKLGDIWYTGIHTNKTGILTEEEFMRMIDDNYESFRSIIDANILDSGDIVQITKEFGGEIL